jgi:uncharacterized membrane protein
MRVLCTALVGTFLFAGTAADAQSVRTLTPLEGYDYAQPTGISSNGRYVVGLSMVRIEPFHTPTLWDSDRKPHELIGLQQPRGVSNDASVIVGTANVRATVLTPTGIIDLGAGAALDVSAQGSVVVGYLNSPTRQGFCYSVSSGILTSLLPAEGDDWSDSHATNDAGTFIVGTTRNSVSDVRRACVWSASGGRPLIVLDMGTFRDSFASGVSADGSVVAGRVGSTAARWVDGHLEVIASGNGGASCLGLSDDGTLLVGRYYEPPVEWDWGFLYDARLGLLSLRNILTDAHVDLSHLEVQGLDFMSSDGHNIVGLGWTVETDLFVGIEVVLDADCPADFNADFVADFFDYLDFVALYDVQDPRADFNGDQTVDFFDYLDFVAAFEAGCD